MEFDNIQSYSLNQNDLLNMNRNHTHKKRTVLFSLMLIITMVVIVTSIIFTFFLVQYRITDLVKLVDSRLFTAAELAQEVLGPSFHDRIVDKSSVSTEEFAKIVAKNDDLCRRLKLQYLWSVLTVDGQLVFSSATHSNINDPNSHVASFFEIHDNPDAFNPALNSGFKPSFSSFKNKWGEGRQILIPRKDTHGRTYIIGASVQLTELNSMVRKTIVTSFSLCLLVIGATSLLALILARSFTLPIAKLSEATSLIANGKFDISLEPLKTRELHSLSISLDQMRTRIKQQLVDLNESKNRLALALSGSGEGIIDWDLVTDYIVVSPELAGMLGYTISEFPTVGTDFLKLIHPDDRGIGDASFLKLLNGDSTKFAIEERLKSKDGSWKWILASGNIVSRDNSGKPLRYLGTHANITERKTAEIALQESEDRYRRIVETANEGIWTMDRDHRTTFINGRMAQILGREPTEVVGKPVEEFLFHDDLRLHQQHMIERHLGLRGSYQARLYRPDKSIVWTMVSSTPKIDAHGEFDGSIAMITDITEHKKAEENYKTLFREMLNGFALHEIICNSQGDPIDYRFTAVNPAFELITGHSSNDIIGRSIGELFVDLEQHVIDAFREVARSGTPAFIENYSKTLKKHFEISVFRPSLSQLACVFADITKRKLAEDALKESQKNLADIIDFLPDATLAIDTNKRVIIWNRAIQQMTDIPAHEMLGKGDYAYTIPFYGKPRAQLMDLIFADDKSISDKYPNLRREGDAIIAEVFCNALYDNKGAWVYLKVSPLRDQKGNITGAIEIIRDVTKAKQSEKDKQKLQEQLIQSQKMESIGRLAGGVAHDFNNMLGVIIGRTELAKSHVTPNQPIYNDLEEILIAAERSANLTRQLLAFARKQTVAPKILDLNEIISGMLKMIERLIGEDIVLNWRPGENIWPTKTDPSQIDQILANLCINARDAISNIGTITIETENQTFDETIGSTQPDLIPGDYVMIAVSDDGRGMDQETISHIFEPFFTTKELGKGTGLGLATVYGAVKQNNGIITVYSEPNRGSTFKIFLPRHSDNTKSLPSDSSTEMHIGGLETILVVEDEPSILTLTQIILETQGYQVLIASTPGEAIRIATEYTGIINLLISDVVMPEMNGRDLAKHLLETTCPKIKLLFMSGYTANVIAHHGVIDEGVDFIQKPFSTANLAKKVRAVLDSK